DDEEDHDAEPDRQQEGEAEQVHERSLDPFLVDEGAELGIRGCRSNVVCNHGVARRTRPPMRWTERWPTRTIQICALGIRLSSLLPAFSSSASTAKSPRPRGPLVALPYSEHAHQGGVCLRTRAWPNLFFGRNPSINREEDRAIRFCSLLVKPANVQKILPGAVEVLVSHLDLIVVLRVELIIALPHPRLG